MAANSTPNFSLNQWEADDPVLREDFNADNQKLEAALTQLGNCCIAAGSYVGTGGYRAQSPCHISTDFKPMVLFLNTSHPYDDNGHVVWFCPMTSPTHTSNIFVDYYVTWLDDGISWYADSVNENDINAGVQFNEKGVTYTYTVLGYKP